MSTISIIFLIIAGVFFVLGILMYIVQKIITSKIYNKEQEKNKEEKKSNKKNSKLSTIEDIDTSLLDEIENDKVKEL